MTRTHDCHDSRVFHCTSWNVENTLLSGARLAELKSERRKLVLVVIGLHRLQTVTSRVIHDVIMTAR